MLAKVILHYLKDGKLHTVIRIIEESGIPQVEELLDDLSVI
jgi:hypothetical protein